MILRPIEDVRADLDGQQHRRFLKTHTPLDGLPYVAGAHLRRRRARPPRRRRLDAPPPQQPGPRRIQQIIGGGGARAGTAPADPADPAEGPPRKRASGPGSTPTTRPSSGCPRCEGRSGTWATPGQGATTPRSSWCTTATSAPTSRARCGPWPYASGSRLTSTCCRLSSRRPRSSRCASASADLLPDERLGVFRDAAGSPAAARAGSGTASSTLRTWRATTSGWPTWPSLTSSPGCTREAASLRLCRSPTPRSSA